MSKLTWGVIIGVVVIILVIIMAASGSHDSGGAGSSSEGSSDTLSAEASAYLSSAMPTLERILAEFQAGNVDQATAGWNSIGDMPINNSTDDFVSGDYLTYANNVRYYMMQDGSATLRDVEDSKTTAEMTVAVFQ